MNENEQLTETQLLALILSHSAYTAKYEMYRDARLELERNKPVLPDRFNSLDEAREYKESEVLFGTTYSDYTDNIDALLEQRDEISKQIYNALPIPNTWTKVGTYGILGTYKGRNYYSIRIEPWDDILANPKSYS